MPVYSIKFLRQAENYFLRLDRRTQARIVAALRVLAENPFNPAMDVKPLAGYPGRYRLRVGDYPLIYRIDQQELLIFIITLAPRGDVYKK
ncbi:type II toxin-antitoxin system RelE family toxin [Sporolituus thermophilus]|uniref:mRNA interferase RelE/StbE n=1 Tax=Sporolituus thermophilus DSM 23256 TaxID=1123285 RepID=A0A1G7JXC4_9FIRM|nr:type II toxin-antitoxin system RelE/ParE family toxin [Sporolituus thermophilus]SDF29491.1 mRNA interferase RelE/StbE [Sporolituus thermophilus DSM 23256]